MFKRSALMLFMVFVTSIHVFAQDAATTASGASGVDVEI